MTLPSPASASILLQRSGRTLAALGDEMTAKVVAAAADIALVVDGKGVVRDVAVNAEGLTSLALSDWLDRPWIDTAAADSRSKVADMLRRARVGEAPRWREVNHTTAGGAAFLLRWRLVGGGDDGGVVAVGRDMAASAALEQRLLSIQQSVERDYLKLRQAQSLYQLLLRTSSEALLIVDGATRRIEEASPAAARLNGVGEAALIGRPLTALLHADSREAALQLVASAQSGRAPPDIAVRLAGGAPCTLAASAFRQDRSARLLLRLIPDAGVRDAADLPPPLQTVVEAISDGVVLTDADLRVLAVNPAFLDLAQLTGVEQVRDQPLEHYLGRPGIDLKVLLSQLREHGSVRNFPTVLNGVQGSTEEVEVSAAALADGDSPGFGFSIRGVGGRLNGQSPSGVEPPRSVEQLTRLIGRVPMKDIVRESTDLIERMCIEAALALSSNNRAFAAEMLGLSRQSLYSKLHRYGLGVGSETEN